MRPVRIAPFTAMLLCFFVCSCLFAYGSFPLRMGAVTVSALVLSAAVLKIPAGVFPENRPVRRQTAIFLCAGIALAGLISAAAWDLWEPWIESRAGQSEHAVLRVTECEYSYVYASRYRVRVVRSSLLPPGTGLLLETDASSFAVGATVEGEIMYGTLDALDTPSFDARRSYLSSRIFLTAEGTVSPAEQRRAFSLRALFARLNEKLTSVFLAAAGRDTGGFLAAVCLGNRDHLLSSLSRDFRRLGLSHLLAVSGTHFSVLITYLTFFMKRLRLNRKLRAPLTSVLIVFFMFLTGGSPSVLRAGLMQLLVQFSLFFARKPNLIHSFALSGALLLLFSPFSASSCSLQLSFAATWACIVWLTDRGTILRRLREKTGLGSRKNILSRLLSAAVETVLLTAVVTLGTMPLIWLYFGELPLLSVPANVFYLPLTALTLGLGWLLLLLSPLRILTPPLALLLRGLVRLITGTAAKLACLPGVTLSVGYNFAPFLLFPAALCLALLPFFQSRGRRRCALSGLALLCLFFSCVGIARTAARNDAVLVHLAVKKNEGFVLCTDNRVLLCDMTDGTSAVSRRLTAEAEKLHVCGIDAVLLTHYHNRHVQMLGRLFSQEIVRSLWLPEPQSDEEDEICRSLLALCEENGVTSVILSSGEAADFCGIPVTVLPRTWLSRSTHPVCAASVSLPSAGVFFASSSFNEGGLTEAAEAADIVILGGHSPVYKKTFALSFRNEPKILSLCADARDYADAAWLDGLSGRYPHCSVVTPEDGVPLILKDRRP